MWDIYKANNKINLLPIESYEKILRQVFFQIYEALNTLRDKGFIYTDLKPANILIGKKNEAYLIDLESVIQPKSQQVCVYTQKLFPPDITSYKQYDSISLERILSWTFCNTIYLAVCIKNIEYDQWRLWFLKPNNHSFLNFFGCAKKISKELVKFLDTCLTKASNPSSFSNLKSIDWLQNNQSYSKVG